MYTLCRLTKLEPRSNVKVVFATVGSGVKLQTM